MYNQFIYGKWSNGGGDSKIIARTSELTEDNSLQSIVDSFTIWSRLLSSGAKQAVGSVLSHDEKNIILIQAQRVQLEMAAFNQYRYILIPVDDTRAVHYRMDKLLSWLWAQKIPIINNSYNSEISQIKIPLLERPALSKVNEQELKQLKACLQEKDEWGNALVIQGLSALLDGERVLVSREQKFRSPELYLASLLLLTPAMYRPNLSIVVGDIDELHCGWAKLIIKTVTPASKHNNSSLPEGTTWLRREEKTAFGSATKGAIVSPFIDRVNTVVTKSEESIPSLLRDINALQQETLTLDGISTLIEQGAETPFNIKIGLWGLQSSGKTTYLAKLYDCLQQGESDFRIVSLNEAASRFVTFHLKNLEQGVFSRSTNPSVDPKILTYKIQTEYSLFPFSIELNFVDASGEWYRKIGDLLADGGELINTGDIQEEDSNSDNALQVGLVDYLSECDGIIFLLDPGADRKGERSHQYVLPKVFRALRKHIENKNKTTRELGPGNRLVQFMAFCATKVDQSNYWSFVDKPDELVASILGRATKTLSTYCYFDPDNIDDSRFSRCRFFSISSIGRDKDKDSDEYVNSESVQKKENVKDTRSGTDSRSEIDEEIESEGWATPSSTANKTQPEHYEGSIYEIIAEDPEPVNVTAPIEWLISKIQESHSLKYLNNYSNGK